jgi:hypothetical protein
MRVPPFHSPGENDGHFYALAYVPGQYVPPSGQSQGEAFLVLNFSPSEGFTRFSLSTVSRDGYLFHYSRGTDGLDTAEYMMLRAWREEGVPFHAWRFFPSKAVEASAFTDDESRAAFDAARTRVAYIIYYACGHLRIQSQYPGKPLFRFFETDLPDMMVSSPESEDISNQILKSMKPR